MATTGKELGWEDTIENDGADFVTLPKGDYDFEVVSFERARHAGSDKLPPCNKAVVHLKIEGDAGTCTIKHNLFLHTITEGLVCSFFVSIGQRKKGEKLTMNWAAVVGSKGRAKIGIHTWKNSTTGDEMTSNEVLKFLEPVELPNQPAGYTPGSF